MAQSLIANYFQDSEHVARLDVALLRAVMQLLGSAVIALVMGKLTQRLVSQPRFHNFSIVFVAILFCTGLSTYLGFSPLLTSLFFGVYLGNSSSAVEEQLNTLAPIEPLLYLCFFTLAGISLHLDSLAHVGLLCVAYVFARFAGKAVGAALGGVVTKCSRRIWSNMPLALLPQAGVAIGLVVLIGSDPNIPRSITEAMGAIILAAVTINEIIGPMFTRSALCRAREVNKDRPRLMTFLHEEFIMTDLKAVDKWDAIRQLNNFLIRTHRVEHYEPDALYASIAEREKEMSTALGNGIAIPHGRVEKGTSLQGVLAIRREGVDFDAPDGEPVHIIVLVVTPRDHADLHLQVMASISAMVSDEVIRARLIAAVDANDVWEVIESEETRDYNHFLEEN